MEVKVEVEEEAKEEMVEKGGAEWKAVDVEEYHEKRSTLVFQTSYGRDWMTAERAMLTANNTATAVSW